MIRSEAQNFLRAYTDRVLAAQERRRNRTELPLWMDCYDAAAACNQKRSADWDQLDHIQQVFSDLTEMLLQVNIKLYFEVYQLYILYIIYKLYMSKLINLGD